MSKRTVQIMVGHLPARKGDRTEAFEALRKWRNDKGVKVATHTNGRAYQSRCQYDSRTIFVLDQVKKCRPCVGCGQTDPKNQDGKFCYHCEGKD